ncbi:MAG TPA: ROK family protein [Kiritimatiellia bacterium]|nr:ROK family protein [Kiritimatiellia bacterium]
MGDNGKKHWIGFDLGGTKMFCVLFDHKFNVVASVRKKTKAEAGVAGGIERMIEMIESVLDEAHVDRSDLGAIGAGCPGPLDLDRGIVLEAPNLGWKNVDLKEVFQKKFKVPVAIANDVDAGTYGEYRFGAAQKARCVLGVFPGTGIGGGCVYEGRLLRGKTGSCMEFGHMMISSNGRLCGCGRRGCLETVASRLAIAAECAMAVYRGDAPVLAEMAGPDISKIRSGTLADAIKAGDKVVERIVRQAAKQLGVGVGNAINLLAPDVVVLGGGLVEAMKDIFLEEVKDAVSKRAMVSFAKTTDIVAAKLDDMATVMGAAALAAELAG